MSDWLVLGAGAGSSLVGDLQFAAEAAYMPNLIDLTYAPKLEVRYQPDGNQSRLIAGLGVMGPAGFWGYSYARANAVCDYVGTKVSPGAELGFLSPAGLGIFGVPRGGLDLKVSALDVTQPLETGAALLSFNIDLSI